MLHHFQFDPRTILGVGSDASADQIRDAFHEKSKKHHPDLGGDEWAFRMVVRAYEVAQVDLERPRPRGRQARPRRSRRGRPGAGPGRPVDPFARGTSSFVPDAAEPTAEKETEAPTQTAPPSEFRAVDVELIWIRFEMPEKVAVEVPDRTDRATLSVCMVVSWPVKSLVARTAEFAGAGDTLRQVIDGFRTPGPGGRAGGPDADRGRPVRRLGELSRRGRGPIGVLRFSRHPHEQRSLRPTSNTRRDDPPELARLIGWIGGDCGESAKCDRSCGRIAPRCVFVGYTAWGVLHRPGSIESDGLGDFPDETWIAGADRRPGIRPVGVLADPGPTAPGGAADSGGPAPFETGPLAISERR